MSRARFWMVLVLLAGTAWLAPGTANAQYTADQQGSQPNFLYADELMPKNSLVYGLRGEFTYDSNPLATATNPQGDFVYRGGALFSLRRTWERTHLELDYRPDFQFYRRESGLNELNHGLGFTSEFLVTPHFVLRLGDSFSVRRGYFELRTNYSAQPTVITPGTLNSSVLLPPNAREVGNQTNLEADWEVSPRSGVALLGGYAFRKFIGNGGPLAFLLDSRTASGAAGYSYRVTPNVTVGVRYIFENIRFAQIATDNIHNGLVTLSWGIRPGLTLELSGGPEYAMPNEPASVVMFSGLGVPVTAGPAPHNRWDGGASGSLTWRSNDMVLRVFGSRQLSDGGGLLALVRESAGGIEVRRRLTGNWDLLLRAHDSQATSLSEFFGHGAVRSLSGTVALEYPVSKNLLVRFSYVFERQRTSGNVPFAVDFDRSRGGAGFFYQNIPIPSAE